MMNHILQPYIGQVEYEAAAINLATGKVDYLGTPPQSIGPTPIYIAHAHFPYQHILSTKLVRNNFYSIMIHTQCHTINY